MSNIIAENALDVLLNGVREYFEMSEMPVSIVWKTSMTYERKYVVCGINWGGLGTVDPETTRKFLETMEKAVFIAETINGKEWIIHFEGNPLDDEKFETAVNFVCNSLIADVKNIGKIIDILMNGGLA